VQEHGPEDKVESEKHGQGKYEINGNVGGCRLEENKFKRNIGIIY